MSSFGDSSGYDAFKDISTNSSAFQDAFKANKELLNKRTGGLFERNGIMLLAQVDIEEVSTPVNPSPLKPNALMPGK